MKQSKIFLFLVIILVILFTFSSCSGLTNDTTTTNPVDTGKEPSTDSAESNTPQSPSPGLYQNGELVKTWDQLLFNNIISVHSDTGVFRSRYIADASGGIGKNKSSLNLIGELVLSTDVKSIAGRGLSSLENLTSITIPASVTSIGAGSFENCQSLKSVTFEEGCQITKIDYVTFFICSSLESIILPNRVNTIGVDAFNGCTSLTSVTIPESVTIIRMGAFANCNNLSSITFQGTMKQWKTISRGWFWNFGVPATYVQCSDGRVKLK